MLCVYVLLQHKLHPKTLNTLKPHQNREGGRERGREGRGEERRERERERERGEKMKKQKGREK